MAERDGDDDVKSPLSPLETSSKPQAAEMDLLVRSICATVLPKLVSDDVGLFATLMTAVFPGATIVAPMVAQLRAAVDRLCGGDAATAASSGDAKTDAVAAPTAEFGSYEQSPLWIDKIMQLNEILAIHHGVILVGPTASGKQHTHSAHTAAQLPVGLFVNRIRALYVFVSRAQASPVHCVYCVAVLK